VDRNNDNDYYDVVGGEPETPNSGIKTLNIFVVKNGESVGARRGMILSKGGISGNEIRSAQSVHKLKLVRPKKNLWLFQVTPQTQRALELPTRRTYDPYWFDPNDDRGFSARVDNTPSLSVYLNKTLNVNGSSLSSGIVSDPLSQYHYFSGYTDAGVAGDLLVYDQFGSAPDPSGATWWHDFAPMELIGGDLKVFNSVGHRIDFLRSSLMRDGVHKIWSMKRVGTGPYEYSPFDVRTVKVDNGIPKMILKTISTYIWPHGGLTPPLEFRVADNLQVDGVTRSNSSGIRKEVVSAIIKIEKTPIIWKHAWVDKPGSPTINYMVSGSTSFFYVRDAESYPYPLEKETPIEVTYEWGDNVGYKSSTTFRFRIPDPALDTTPPLISVDPSYIYSSPFIIRPADGTPAPVRRNVFHSFVPLQIQDPQSGIDFRSFKVEVCPEGLLIPPMNFSGPTPGCTTIHHHESENKRRDTSVKWGNYFWLSSAIYRPNGYMGLQPSLLPFGYRDIGNIFQIRVGVRNWKGLVKTTSNNYWKVQVVP
jgi:hypothetical protein